MHNLSTVYQLDFIPWSDKNTTNRIPSFELFEKSTEQCVATGNNISEAKCF